MIWLILGAIVVALVVLVALVGRRARRRLARFAPPPTRAAMPTVLVEQILERPKLNVEPSLSDRLSAARSLFDRVRLLGSSESLSNEELETVEEVLLRCDVGVATTRSLLDQLRAHGAPHGVAAAIRTSLLDILSLDRSVALTAEPGRVPVWLFVGVNGVGKTTTIGKLSFQHSQAGRRVVLAAGDTFRAAAADQLELWAERTHADIVRSSEGADPGSVIHDALGRASARGADLVLADTAGRRVNSTNLLDELAKIRRVADREPGQVVETFMVLDATTGQNALSQAREFLEAAQVTGIILTKLDGTARGGIVVAIERELAIPVKFVGVGEREQDLIVFDPTAFVDSLLGLEG